MFGKGLTKIIGYAVAGAIVLVTGAELLTSVVSVVLAFRSGNLIPLLGVIVLTVLLLLTTGHVGEKTPTHMFLNILGYAATGYLIVVTFVIAIPSGLIGSIILAGVTGVLCSFIRNPKNIQYYVSQAFSHIHTSGVFNGLSRRIIPVGDGTYFTQNMVYSILILNEGSRDRIIQLMRDRPLLPISYTHYVDCDVLFITERNNPSKYGRILKLLKEYDIHTKGPASPLLSEAIQMIPIIDSRYGLKLDDYRLTKDEATIANLLELSPPRLTVFPTPTGLCVLVPDMDAPGLNVEPLRRGHEHEVLLHRNYVHLWEVEKVIESAT